MNKSKFLTLLLTAFMFAACSPALSDESRAFDGEAGFATGGGDEFFYEESTSFDTAASDDGAFLEPAAQAPSDISISNTDLTQQERIVIKNANMSIAVANPPETMDAISAMAEEMGGFVVSSNLYQRRLDNGEEVPQGGITIRVPAEKLEEAITLIEAGAGELLSKNVSGQDVTEEYTDLNSRLVNLQQAETQLQSIMDEARDTEDVLNVYNQLVGIREQIEVIQGRIRYFQQSAALSSISVDVIADAAVQPLTIGGWEPAGVAKEAIQALIDALKGIANAGIWVVLFLIPVLFVIYIPLRLVWAGFKRWRTRRKKNPVPVQES